MTVHTRSTFSTDAATRKQRRLLLALQYFPDALAELGSLIETGQMQHGTHGWDRSKSGDELEALLRHVIDAGFADTDGQLHSTKVLFRAAANLQKELENVYGLPLSPASYYSDDDTRLCSNA